MNASSFKQTNVALMIIIWLRQIPVEKPSDLSCIGETQRVATIKVQKQTSENQNIIKSI